MAIIRAYAIKSGRRRLGAALWHLTSCRAPPNRVPLPSLSPSRLLLLPIPSDMCGACPLSPHLAREGVVKGPSWFVSNVGTGLGFTYFPNQRVNANSLRKLHKGVIKAVDLLETYGAFEHLVYGWETWPMNRIIVSSIEKILGSSISKEELSVSPDCSCAD